MRREFGRGFGGVRYDWLAPATCPWPEVERADVADRGGRASPKAQLLSRRSFAHPSKHLPTGCTSSTPHTPCPLIRSCFAMSEASTPPGDDQEHENADQEPAAPRLENEVPVVSTPSPAEPPEASVPSHDGGGDFRDSEDDDVDDDDEEDDDEEEDEEEEEPELKYERLTQHLGAVYRNGDATSSFLVAGDKMVRQRPAVCNE